MTLRYAKWYKFSEYEWINQHGVDCIKPKKGAKFKSYNVYELQENLSKGTSKSSIYTLLAQIDVFKRLLIPSLDSRYFHDGKGNKYTPTEEERLDKEQDFKYALKNFKSEIMTFVNEYGLLGYYHHDFIFHVGKPIFFPNIIPKSSNPKLKKNKLHFDYDLDNESPTFISSNNKLKEFYNSGKIPQGYKINGLWPYQLIARFDRGYWDFAWKKCEVKQQGSLLTGRVPSSEYFKDYKPFDYLKDEDYKKLRINTEPGLYSNNNLAMPEWVLYPEFSLKFKNKHLIREFEIYKLNEKRSELFFSENILNFNFDGFYSEKFFSNYSEPLTIYVAFIDTLRNALQIESNREIKNSSYMDIQTLGLNMFNSLNNSFSNEFDEKNKNIWLESLTHRDIGYNKLENNKNTNYTYSPSLIGYIGEIILNSNKTKICPNCNSHFTPKKRDKIYCSTNCQIEHKNKKNYAPKKALNKLISDRNYTEAKKSYNLIFSNKSSKEAKDFKKRIDAISK